MSQSEWTVDSLSQWLRAWVHKTTGVPLEEISDDKSMETFGLSSRDVVILSGELENLLGVKLDATVAYEYPTIGKLTARLLEGEPNRRDRVRATPVTVDNSLPEQHDIAVVGYAARFPKAETPEDMWELLVSGQSATGPLPANRWTEYSSDPVTTEKLKKVNTTGGYLSDISAFDPEFFGLSPLEASNMDPQQRIILEVAYEALQNAGIPANELRGESVGVYIGSTNNDYGMLISSDPAEAHPYALTGNSSAVIPNRISYAFDFRGPSVSIDTACSSSLVSVHHAIRALRNGEADVALAGGINIMSTPFVSVAFGELGVISPSGGIRAFSEDADGFVRSDGAGVLVLKRVGDALKDGDNILAVLKGSAVNSDGRSNGLTAPNPDAQIEVLEQAYRDAGVDPLQVDYVEAHGTGTILGDPIEASALGEVLGRDREVVRPLLLGSAKTNFGHSESAAGSAGLIKVIMGLQNGVIPPSINYTAPNPYIDFDGLHLEVVEDPREWPAYSGKPVAGVSGFGFGGTNAHVVVSAFDPADYETQQETQPAQLGDSQVILPVSGLLPSRRRAAAAQLADYLESNQVNLLDLERTLGGFNHARSRAAVLASSQEEAIKRLRLVAEGKKAPGVEQADQPMANGPVFVYSGFGSQHRKMAKDLYQTSADFKTRMDELDQLVQFESGWSVVELIEDDEQTYNTETAQVAITAIQIALTDWLAAAGVKPAAVMGMSMGEIAAAYAAGGLSAKDAMVIACHRSRLMGEGEASLPEDQLGAMAVVEFSVEQLDELIATDPSYEGIEPAVYAGPGMTTVGGPREKVTALVESLEQEGKFARLLNVKGAGHTSAVEPLLGELALETAAIEPLPTTIPLFSSVDRGVVYPAGSVVHDSDYWLRCTRGSVWFLDATEAAFAAGHTMLVEVSPNPVALMGMMNTAFSVGKSDAQLLFTLKRKVPAVESLNELLAKLYVAGQPVNFDFLTGSGARAAAPATLWKHAQYWTAARPSGGGTSRMPGAKVAMPAGVTAFAARAEEILSVDALIEAAVQNVDGSLQMVALNEYAALPAQGDITTVINRNLGGATVHVYHIEDGSERLLAEAFAAATGALGNLATQGTAAAAVGAPTVDGAAGGVDDSASNLSFEEEEFTSLKWDPAKETVEERLRAIVSESMGYEVEDLPAELPLIDLGLDSLMGMRIKNRVEHDFDIPPLEVQALRDASVADVVTMVEELVQNRGASQGEDESSDQKTVVEGSDQAVETAASGDAQGSGEAENVVSATANSDAATKSEATPQGVGVAPRDASERLVFATWATFTSKAAAGVTSPLPEISEEIAEQIAERLTERGGIEFTAAEVAAAETLEDLANKVREGLETEVEGNIRVLRARQEGSTKPALFMFHPAGGSSVVYQPLMRRLPEDVPVYGVERLEGPLAERAENYLEEIKKYSDGLPIILGGWSFGGALAYEVAHQLVNSDVKVEFIALLDTVQPAEPAPDTPEETRARWERYSAFAKKTYGLDFPVPYELLESAGEEALLAMMAEFLATTDASEHGLAAGVLEHQRASFVDNRILAQVNLADWADVSVPVVLFRAERMHDGAIELEPTYANIAHDGGWSQIVDELEIVQLVGDHLAVVDEPEIGKVGAVLTRRIQGLE